MDFMLNLHLLFPCLVVTPHPGPTVPNNGGLWTKLWHFDVYENATALSAEHVERQSKVFRGREKSMKKLASSMGFGEFVGLQRWVLESVRQIFVVKKS